MKPVDATMSPEQRCSRSDVTPWRRLGAIVTMLVAPWPLACADEDLADAKAQGKKGIMLFFENDDCLFHRHLDQ